MGVSDILVLKVSLNFFMCVSRIYLFVSLSSGCDATLWLLYFLEFEKKEGKKKEQKTKKEKKMDMKTKKMKNKKMKKKKKRKAQKG